jgi:hypothetical protein
MLLGAAMTPIFKAILSATFFACLLSLSVEVARADEYLPMTSSPGTGKEFGRYYRTDGSPPTQDQAETDKRSCFMDDREISKPVADRISALAKTNPEAAGMELAKAIRCCMSAKGWRIVMEGDLKVPERSTIAAVDVALDQMASMLPRQMDEHSDLVLVKRDRNDVIYTIQIRVKSQSVANEARKFGLSDPRAAEIINKSLMKQSLCEPELNRYLREGFAIIWEMRDAKGIVSRTRLTGHDCK